MEAQTLPASMTCFHLQSHSKVNVNVKVYHLHIFLLCYIIQTVNSIISRHQLKRISIKSTVSQQINQRQ